MTTKTLATAGLLAALLGTTACTTVPGGYSAGFAQSNTQVVFLKDQPFLIAPGGKLVPIGDQAGMSFDDRTGGTFREPQVIQSPYSGGAVENAGEPDAAVSGEDEEADTGEPMMLAAVKAEPARSDREQAAERAIAAIERVSYATDAGPQRRALTTADLAGGEEADAERSDLPPAEIIEAANRSARGDVSRDGFINSVQVFNYEPGVLYQLYAAPKRLTAITLQPGERVLSKAAGDTVRWMLAETVQGSGENQQTVLLLKPLRDDVATNIYITTNRRSYALEAQAHEGDAYMAAVSWNYPMDQIADIRANVAAQEQAEESTVSDLGDTDPTELNYAYDWRTTEGGGGLFSSRDPKWSPTRVFDNGSKVWIQFPDAINSTEAPALFVRRNGESAIINYRVKGNFYIVDRLFDAAELRVGHDDPTVVRIEKG